MKRIIPLPLDIYDSKQFQRGFYVDEKTGNLRYSVQEDSETAVLWYNQLQDDHFFLQNHFLSKEEALTLIKKYQDYLTTNDPKEYNIYNAGIMMQASFINTTALLLCKVIYLRNQEIQDASYDLLKLFISSLSLLNYDPNEKNDFINQIRVGTLRSFFLSKQNYLSALELKKELQYRKNKKNNV